MHLEDGSGIDRGDLIIFKKVKDEELLRGSIIIFRDGNSYTTHRIHDFIDGKIQTKGDSINNTSPDKNLVEYSAVQGVVVGKIKNAGKFIEWVKKPQGLICLLVVGFAIYEIPHLIKLKKENKELENSSEKES